MYHTGSALRWSRTTPPVLKLHHEFRAPNNTGYPQTATYNTPRTRTRYPPCFKPIHITTGKEKRSKIHTKSPPIENNSLGFVRFSLRPIQKKPQPGFWGFGTVIVHVPRSGKEVSSPVALVEILEAGLNLPFQLHIFSSVPPNSR